MPCMLPSGTCSSVKLGLPTAVFNPRNIRGTEARETFVFSTRRRMLLPLSISAGFTAVFLLSLIFRLHAHVLLARSHTHHLPFVFLSPLPLSRLFHSLFWPVSPCLSKSRVIPLPHFASLPVEKKNAFLASIFYRPISTGKEPVMGLGKKNMKGRGESEIENIIARYRPARNNRKQVWKSGKLKKKKVRKIQRNRGRKIAKATKCAHMP